MPLIHIEIEQVTGSQFNTFVEVGFPRNRRMGPEAGLRGPDIAEAFRQAWHVVHELGGQEVPPLVLGPPETLPAPPERVPVVEPKSEPPHDDGEPDIDALRAEAEAAGIKVDGRWGESRLREEIAKAGSE